MGALNDRFIIRHILGKQKMFFVGEQIQLQCVFCFLLWNVVGYCEIV